MTELRKLRRASWRELPPAEMAAHLLATPTISDDVLDLGAAPAAREAPGLRAPRTRSLLSRGLTIPLALTGSGNGR
jgi:hypothetical protein